MTTSSTGVPQSAQPARSHGSSRGGYAVAGIIVTVVVAAIVGFTFTRRSKVAGGRPTSVTTLARATSAPSTDTTSSSSASGISPAGIPAAQANPPSLSGAYAPEPIIVMKTLSPYIDWLFAHPNPALLSNYMFPTCSHYNAVKAELTTLANNGWHARPSVAEIQWIKVNIPFTLHRVSSTATRRTGAAA